MQFQKCDYNWSDDIDRKWGRHVRSKEIKFPNNCNKGKETQTYLKQIKRTEERQMKSWCYRRNMRYKYENLQDEIWYTEVCTFTEITRQIACEIAVY